VTPRDVGEAFAEADREGMAVLAFASHDYRDMSKDVLGMMQLIKAESSKWPNVGFRYSGVEAAAIEYTSQYRNTNPDKLSLSVSISDDRLDVSVDSGETFGPQPYLAIESLDGQFLHDNFDIIEPFQKWSYILDDQTLPLKHVKNLGVGSAGSHGGFYAESLRIN